MSIKSSNFAREIVFCNRQFSSITLPGVTLRGVIIRRGKSSHEYNGLNGLLEGKVVQIKQIEGNEQFDTDFPREQQRMSFFYWQMRDGLSGFTHRIFTIIDNDSVYTKFWDEDVSGIPELKTSVCPLDSFIVRKDTILYPHKGYFPMHITKNANNP